MQSGDTAKATRNRPAVRVLFVCLGNICRSPLAEGVFRALIRDAGMEASFEVDSAGTADYHVGELPDRRTREVARRNGIELTSRARQLEREDLDRFDYVVVMDTSNLRDVKALADAVPPGAEVHLLREFDPESHGQVDVPDPYYGGPRGFQLVQEIVERSCRGLFQHIETQRAL